MYDFFGGGSELVFAFDLSIAVEVSTIYGSGVSERVELLSALLLIWRVEASLGKYILAGNSVFLIWLELFLVWILTYFRLFWEVREDPATAYWTGF